ncbi:Protein KINESIN LIGHT CHAIN-RELATED 1 [Cardamine amara subsp. amara]|uniref:Protein KINESIN LIGHT CHAIN-RELATED 1 n=1 Tax=Cardamine amara subsp. amara TaxID=228776 RepID=A0ABD0ZN14_CARAN
MPAMPGLVSVKTPADAPPLRVAVPDTQPLSNPPRTPMKKTPSSTPSRSKPSPGRSSGKKDSPSVSSAAVVVDVDDPSLDNPDLGPFLLKLARDAIASGEGPNKALDYAIRATKSFERCCAAVAPPIPGGSDGGPVLDLAMSLHVLAAIYCSLGRFDEAVPPLERAIQVPDPTRGPDHSLAAFSGHMQLGDTLSMLGQIDRSIACYEEGLKIQIQTLGDTDPRVGETCRYLAEAYVQAMQFNKAEELCKKTLEIHRAHSEPASLEEAADRRLMAIICEAKGDYENALEHLVLASMAMIASGQESEVASIDVSIGNIYMALCRFDEAVFSYQKALTVFKSSKGETHPTVASVFVRLAELYHRTGKLRESKSYCENALRIYNKPVPGTTVEEIAGGLTEISAIYESVDEPEEALKLLQKSMKLLEDKPGQQSAIAGLEARMGVMYYTLGRYEEARNAFESAVTKLRAAGELFEEARVILEQERGPCDQDTLGVYSNLAATYDAMGRIEDAIEILEQVLKLREEKLGIANPDFEDEKKRLAELLKEAGRSRNHKAKSLQNLIDPNARPPKKESSAKKWPSLGFKF